MLCKATAGLGVPVSVFPCVGATCPFIIFESADIDSAVDGVIEAAFKKKREVVPCFITSEPPPPPTLQTPPNPPPLPPQVHWVLCVQESVLDGVVARLRLRLAGRKCVALPSEADRVLVEAAVQEAQQQGAKVRQEAEDELCSDFLYVAKPVNDLSLFPQLVQSCAAPPSGDLYPPTVLCGAAPSSPFVVNPSPGPLLPLMTFRSNTEAVTLGKDTSGDTDVAVKEFVGIPDVPLPSQAVQLSPPVGSRARWDVWPLQWVLGSPPRLLSEIFHLVCSQGTTVLTAWQPPSGLKTSLWLWRRQRGSFTHFHLDLLLFVMSDISHSRPL